MGALSFIGFTLVAFLFVGSGYTKVAESDAVANGIRSTKFYDLAVKNGIPLNEGNNLELFVTILGACMIVAGLMFAFGVLRKLAAIFLTICVVSFAVFVHLNLEDPAATDNNNQAHILKNLAIAGALLAIAFGFNNNGGSGEKSGSSKKRKTQ